MQADLCYVMKEPSFWGSNLDEEAFFRWLQSIPGVVSIDGFDMRFTSSSAETGAAHRIGISRVEFNEWSLRELLALYHRYNLDFGELAIFVDENNRNWVYDKRKFWAHGFDRAT